MPQDAWSKKDERMYDHIKESAKERGKSEDRAEEIAARTVNKHRQEEGRTKKKSYGGTGNPNEPLDQRTVQQLRNRAKQLGIEGRSGMTKAELVKAIRARQ